MVFDLIFSVNENIFPYFFFTNIDFELKANSTQKKADEDTVSNNEKIPLSWYSSMVILDWSMGCVCVESLICWVDYIWGFIIHIMMALVRVCYGDDYDDNDNVNLEYKNKIQFFW